MKSSFSISIIGAGRLGGALAIALHEKDFRIENLAARNLISASKIADQIEPRPNVLSAGNFSELSSEIILITTQDTEVKAVSEQLADQLQNKPFVFHTSGSLSSEILDKLNSIGCQIGSIHPLISVSDAIKGAKKFKDAYFCIEGDAAAVEIGEKIVEKLNGKSFTVETEYKALYHAAAVTASGHLTTLIDASIEMLTVCGLAADKAKKILLPLIKSTVENLEEQSSSEALTGTFARADTETLARHLAILPQKISPQILELYLLLGSRSLDLVARRGAGKVNLEKMRKQILLAKKHLK